MVRALSALVLVALALPARGASELPSRIGMYPQQGAALAMLDSDVRVRVRGPIVEATIVQTFRNDTDRVTEATYIFPLPPDAAVSAMEITTGKRTIRAAIELRAKAVARYEAAVSAGIGAGLLEQERPDVFTQTVSAIPARGTVTVTLRVDTVARYSHGTWELALPLVVAPRYVPGTASGRPTTGSGRAPDTERAPDASRVTPGGAPGAGGRTDLHITFTETVDAVTSPSHELTAISGGYALADPKSDHDVILRWRAKSAQQAWVESSPVSGEGGFAAVVVEAKPAPARGKSELRVNLVLDRAATTRGDAEAVQRAVIRHLMTTLTPRDRVAVTGSDTFAAAAPDATLRAIDDAWRTSIGPFDLTKVLTSLRGRDGALVLVSDGLVADDRAALAAAAKLGAPLHVIGVGPAPNRSLLTQLAQTTNGTIRFASVGDDYAALARDVIADAITPPEAIAITWGTLTASDVVPAKLPRIGAGQALLVVARVKKVEKANARVRGDVFGFTPVKADTAPGGATSTRGLLARRWAKLSLDELVAINATKKLADHALTFGLVSPATAMVAIGDEVVVEGGVKHSVSVPVSVPAGMQWQLVKQQTTVQVKTTTTGGESIADSDHRKKTGTKKAKDELSREPAGAAADDGDGEAARGARTFEDAAPPAPAPMVDSVATGSSMEYDGDDEEEFVEIRSSRSRRAVRLALALGGGVAFAGGESAPLGSLGLRADVGRGRTLVGVDASIWLVDGFNGQGGLFATVSRRGFARIGELSVGAGLRLTGDAIGPALQAALRVLLPPRGFALYLRYDGALLRQDDVSTGQNAVGLGVEARW